MSNSSLMDTLFQRSLDDLIKGIRLYSPESSISSFISKSIEEIRREIKSTDPSTKSTALLKLTYLNSIFGLDMSWAAFHIVEVISFPQFPLKKIGYLAATVSFNQDTEVILLVTNQFKKDFSSPNDFEASLALHCLSIIGTPDLCRDLCNDLYVLLSSTRIYVRKKAIAVVLKVFRKYPDAVRVCFKKLVENLQSSDPQVVCAVIGVFCELASSEPKSYLPLAPEFYKILSECKNNWVLIKVVKIFAKLAPLEPRLAKKIVEPICDVMRRTMAKSLLFECIRAVVSSLSDYESAVKLSVSKIKEFLSEDDPNLKYLGLQALSDLAVTHSWAVMENKEAVIKSLSDLDPNIKLASLHLLMAMVSEDNVAEITQVLLNYALRSDPEFCNEILRSLLDTCSKNYYEIVVDFDWYVLLLGDMSRIPHCQTGEEIEIQIVDIGMRVKDARPELVKVARDLLIDPALLGNPYLHRILSAAAWVSGEYVECSNNPFELMEALMQPRTNLLPPSIRAVYIQSMLKVLVFSLQSYLWKKDEEELDLKAGFQLPESHDSNTSVDKNENGVARQAYPSFSVSGENVSAQELVSKLLNLTESALGPLSWNHDIEVQERARNVLGIVELMKEAILVADLHEDNTTRKEDKITKLIFDMFAEEIGPVSANVQSRIPVPDGLALKDNLSDLDMIYGDLLSCLPTSFSLGTSHSAQMDTDLFSIGQSKEDMNSSLESESLLSQHRKRHDLYYLSPEKNDSTSTDYPPANDHKVVENEVDDLVKLTESTLIPKKKRNHAKPRPVVVKLDESENLLPTKKLEATEDLLSCAVRDILLNNDDLSTSSRVSEASKQSELMKGKGKLSHSSANLTDNIGKAEIGNLSCKRTSDETHGKERRQHTQGEVDDGKEERRSRKEKKKSNRHKSQRKKTANIAVNTTPTPDFLL